jgi:RimJ/RimL family protein N-acetyltransferase
MSGNFLEGQYVCLTVENPEIMAKNFTQWNLDTEYYRLLDSEPPRLWSEKKWKEWLEKDLEKDDPNDFLFAIRTRQEGKVIGFTGFFDFHWNHGDTLMVIAIGEREYWGKGYGTDTLNTLLRYAFLELNLRRVSLIVFEYNGRAQRSYEKAGFVQEGRIRGAMLREGKRWDWLIMGVLREDWLRKQE